MQTPIRRSTSTSPATFSSGSLSEKRPLSSFAVQDLADRELEKAVHAVLHDGRYDDVVLAALERRRADAEDLGGVLAIEELAPRGPIRSDWNRSADKTPVCGRLPTA